MRDNIEAVRTAFTLDRERRTPTERERALLERYCGFGGLKCILNPARELADAARWAKSDLELFAPTVELHRIIRENSKDETEYKRYVDSLKASVLTAFYTPKAITDTIADVLHDKKVRPNLVLEPSAGMGAFIGSVLSDNPQAEVMAFEKDLLTGKMLGHLYPQQKIRTEGFEKIEKPFLNRFDLAISNIPFGDIAVFDHRLAQHDRYKWDFVQIQLNYVDWKHAKEVNTRNTDAEYLYGELEKRGIPTVIMEPLLGGRLSNVHDHIAAHLKQRRPSSSVASWAFRFAGSFPGVLTVLSGMTYMEHLQDNLRTYSPLDELTDDDKEFLEQTAQLMLRYPTIPCNDCKYCMPCPYGLDIPAILLHYNKCVNEGNVATSSQDENYRRARRAFLVGYDRSVPKLRQASHCIGCNQCVPHCPQNIRIPQELHRIDRFAEHLKQDNL